MYRQLVSIAEYLPSCMCRNLKYIIILYYMSYTKNNKTILIPTGGVIAYAASSIPEGWLLCNGSAISRVTYSELFSIIQTNFGVGDGSTTFNLPNYQGAFLRGAGTQTHSSITYGYLTGTTTARTINTAQGTSTQTHSHEVTDPGHSHGVTNASHTHGVGTGNHRHKISQLAGAYIWGGSTRALWGGGNDMNGFDLGNTGHSGTGISINSAISNISVNNATSNISIDNNITNADNNESRPFNFAINWIIKI